ncbi:hypothetical protein MRX96_048327 [Rhipicephalus microplus]
MMKQGFNTHNGRAHWDHVSTMWKLDSSAITLKPCFAAASNDTPHPNSDKGRWSESAPHLDRRDRGTGAEPHNRVLECVRGRGFVFLCPPELSGGRYMAAPAYDPALFGNCAIGDLFGGSDGLPSERPGFFGGRRSANMATFSHWVWVVVWTQFVLFLTLSATADGQKMYCPSNCSCLGSLFECRRRGLTEIPRDLPTWVEIL